MKKIIALIMAALLALMMLAGCSSSDVEETEDTEDTGIEVEEEYQADFTDLSSFTAVTLDGGDYSNKDFADADLTIINTWATWCGPCTDEMPDLAKFAATLPDNIKLITYCLDGLDDPEEAERILKEVGFNGITLVDGEGDLDTFSDQLQYIPTTVFVDSNGKITGEAIIGSQDDLAAEYTKHINDALALLGKQGL